MPTWEPCPCDTIRGCLHEQLDLNIIHYYYILVVWSNFEEHWEFCTQVVGPFHPYDSFEYVYTLWSGVISGQDTGCLKCSAEPTYCHIHLSCSSHHSPAQPWAENTSVPSQPICSVTLSFWFIETLNMFQKNIIWNNLGFLWGFNMQPFTSPDI